MHDREQIDRLKVPALAPLKGRLHALSEARSIGVGEHMHCCCLLVGLAVALLPGMHGCPERTLGQGLHEPEPPAHGRAADQLNHDPLGIGMGIDGLRSHLLLLLHIVYEHCSNSSRGAERKPGMLRLLPILDKGMRGKVDGLTLKPLAPTCSRRSRSTKVLDARPSAGTRRCPSALSVSDKIEGTVLLSDTKSLPV